MMADDRLDLAEALLAKARSTSFDGERQSFVAGAYHQLSAFLGSDRTSRRLAGERSGNTRAIGQRQLAALTAPVELAPQDPDPPAEPPTVVDLAAAERAYRSHGGRAPSGVLVDLAI